MRSSGFAGWRRDCHVAPAVDDLAAAGYVWVFATVGPVAPDQFADGPGAAGAAAHGFAEGCAVEPFAQKEAEARLRQPVDGVGAVDGLCAQCQPGGGEAGAVAVESVDHAQVEEGGILDVAGEQLVERGCVDELLSFVTDQAALLSMHEEKLVDGMCGADVYEGAGQIGGGGGVIFKDEDAVVAAVGAEETEQELCVFFGQPIYGVHRPVWQVDAVDMADVFEENYQRQGFASGGRGAAGQIGGWS